MDDTGHPELSSLDLMSSKTFGSFEDRTSEGLLPESKVDAKSAESCTHVMQKGHEAGWC